MRYLLKKRITTFLFAFIFTALLSNLFAPVFTVYAQTVFDAASGGSGREDALNTDGSTNTTTGTDAASGGSGREDALNTDGSTNTTDPTTGTESTSGGNTATTPPPSGANIVESATYINQLNAEQEYGYMIGLGGWIAGLGGNIFELSFSNFVLKLGCYFVNSGDCSSVLLMEKGSGKVGAIVNELWKIIRDLFNLAMIMSIVYIGFKLILDADDSTAKKNLTSLIIAALLVNFSLYFAKLVIDVANFTTVQIYSQMLADPASAGTFSLVSADSNATSTGNFSVKATNESSIASSFMQVLLISSWFSEGSVASSWIFAIGALIFLSFLGLMFLYGAFMILYRFIALVILLIFSPVLFIGMVLPTFKSYSSAWRKKFIAYAFYAPAYVFLLYLSLYVLIQLRPTTGTYAQAFSEDSSTVMANMPIFLFFFIGMGMLYLSTKLAGSMSLRGAEASLKVASNAGKKITGYAATASLGAAGAGALMLANKRESETGKPTTSTHILNYAGKRMRDQKVFGVNTGKVVMDTKKQFKDGSAAATTRASNLYDKAQKDEKYKKATEVLTNPTSTPDEIERTIAGMKPEAIIEFAKTEKGKVALTTHAEKLRPEQIKALTDSKELSKADTNAIADTRKAAKKNSYNTKPEDIKEASSADLALFDVADFEKDNGKLAVHMTDEAIKKLPDDKFIESDKNKIKKARDKAFEEIVRTNTTIGGISTSDLLAMQPKDTAKLPIEVFRQSNFSEKLSANTVKSRFFADLDKSTQSEILTHLTNAINNIPGTASQAELDRLSDIDAWLKSPQGSSFGK